MITIPYVAFVLMGGFAAVGLVHIIQVVYLLITIRKDRIK